MKRDKRLKEKKLINFVLISFIIFFGLLILFFGVIAFSSRSQFCALCHEQKAQVDSWKVSTHRKVNCIACHVDPGLVNLLKDKLLASKSLYHHLFGGFEKPINKESKLSLRMSSESCLSCHRLKGEVVSLGIIMNHKAHENVNFKCPFCHNRVAHQIKGYEKRLTMEYCLTCHTGNPISNRCTLCHTPSFLEKNKERSKIKSGSK